MSPDRGEMAELLSRAAPDIAAETTRRHFAAHPELEQRWGSHGRTRCTEDGIRHLEYLVTTVRTGRREVFDAYVDWVASVLEGLGICGDDLTAHLSTLRDVIAEHAPELVTVLDDVLRSTGGARDLAAASEPLTRTGHPLSELADRYLAELLGGSRQSAAALILDAVEAGVPVADVYVHVFQPVLREIGRLWQRNEINVGQEHLATAVTQLVMAQLYPRIFDPARPRIATMVAACVGGELHEVGLRMVADILELDGWDTHVVGANVPTSSIVDLARERRAQVVAISATLATHLERAAEVVAAVRAGTDARILVGGRAFLLVPDLWRELGADATAHDAVEAVRVARELLAR